MQYQRSLLGLTRRFLSTQSTIESTLKLTQKLTVNEKRIIYNSLKKEFQSEEFHLLTKFGRVSAHDHDLVTEEVKETAKAESAVTLTRSDIWAVSLKNCLPFIGFGFLDNLIMILAGDWIDMRIGTLLGISTMAAAALGNTISDVAGIASAWYVERFAEKFGIREPDLTEMQLKTWQCRWAVSMGRAVGVVIGCLLGMFPLLFLKKSDKDKEKEKEREKNASA